MSILTIFETVFRRVKRENSQIARHTVHNFSSGLMYKQVSIGCSYQIYVKSLISLINYLWTSQSHGLK